jgi:DNA-binding XRE family transcriptional regulator
VTGFKHTKVYRTFEEFIVSRIKVSETGCWEWQSKLDSRGYACCPGSVWSNTFKQTFVHRMMYVFLNGPITPSLHVCHKCDNPCCVNPEHLFPGDAKINNADKVNKDRQTKGATHVSSKLTEDQVREIKRDTHISGYSLAKKLNVNDQTIYDIRNGVTWKHIT